MRDRVVVIEDAAHALGGRPRRATGRRPRWRRHDDLLAPPGQGDHHRRGRRWSTTEDDELAGGCGSSARTASRRRASARRATEGGWYYEMQALGFNYRITDFQCALGLSQLERLDDCDRRSATRSPTRYRELLADEDRIALPPGRADGLAARLPPLRRPRARRRRGAAGGLRRAARARASASRSTTSRSTGSPYYRDVLGYPQDDVPGGRGLLRGRDLAADVPGHDRRRRRARRRRAAASAAVTPETRTLAESARLLERARARDPGVHADAAARTRRSGSQGVAPAYLARAEGAHVWDVDGNQYVDFPMALGPVILGYAAPGGQRGDRAPAPRRDHLHAAAPDRGRGRRARRRRSSRAPSACASARPAPT